LKNFPAKTFSIYQNYNYKNLKGGVKYGCRTTKSANSKSKGLYIKLTAEQFAEIEKVAKNLKITKTEAVLRGIKNLSQIQPVYYRHQMPGFVPKKIPKHSEGIIAED